MNCSKRSSTLPGLKRDASDTRRDILTSFGTPPIKYTQKVVRCNGKTTTLECIRKEGPDEAMRQALSRSNNF